LAGLARNGDTGRVRSEMVTWDELQLIVGLSEYNALEERYA
jgi:hypothetical protein